MIFIPVKELVFIGQDIDKENRLPPPFHKDSLLVVATGKIDSAKHHLVLRAFADKL